MIWDFPYDSPQAITKLLTESGFAMSKKFGQNFLISPTARKRIADTVMLGSGRDVWEIGPGIGSLTALLLTHNVQLTAFEIDRGFVSILREQAFPEVANFRLIAGDVLKTWYPLFEAEGTPDTICGNLPYNIGSICIARFLEAKCHPQRMVFTLQREVGERLAAGPGSKLWATLSILAQIDYDVHIEFTIRPGSFYPPPQVDSVVVRMEKRAASLVNPDVRDLFLLLIRDLFAQRRKTVRNNLLRGTLGGRLGKDVLLASLASAGIAESERAERLSIPQLVQLAETLDTAQSFQASIH